MSIEIPEELYQALLLEPLRHISSPSMNSARAHSARRECRLVRRSFPSRGCEVDLNLSSVTNRHLTLMPKP